MAISGILEPLVVITLLVGGTLVNRASAPSKTRIRPYHETKRKDSESSTESGLLSPTKSENFLESEATIAKARADGWRQREVAFFRWRRSVWTPDTSVFEDRLLSRILRHYPFLVEVWYWALIYWVYQLGRAFTAVTLVQGTVHTARNHALQVIALEQRLHIFFEPALQQHLLQYPRFMHAINLIYSFIHIPGTILFLILLFNYTITTPRPSTSRINAHLYASRRRAMGLSNLLAFVVFTLWPCMPPRLLSDPKYTGPAAKVAKSYGFIDTVHGAQGQSSVWTSNKFCNQYAAMPSLHFGYSLLVGVTLATIPLEGKRLRVRRAVCVFLGLAYPVVILVAILATANHFVLDAVAGAVVCTIAWNANGVLTNLVVVEDWFLWALRLHKPMMGKDDHEGMEKSGYYD